MQFESKEARLNKNIDALNADFANAMEEHESAMNQFDLKSNNGGEISTEDVRSLYRGILKMDEINEAITDNMRMKGIDVKEHKLSSVFELMI